MNQEITQAILYQLRTDIDTLPPLRRQVVYECASRIRALVARDPLCVIALTLVGAEESIKAASRAAQRAKTCNGVRVRGA
jgi:hypothetical protein